MAHSYKIALMFSQAKASSHIALVRSFQLALTLTSVSLNGDSGLEPCHRRSLFTLASSMLILSAKAGKLHDLIPFIKKMLAEAVDPFLHLIEESRLVAVYPTSGGEMMTYGSVVDQAAAIKSLSAIEVDKSQLRETVLSHYLKACDKLSEEEQLTLREQLQQDFLPDDAYPLGPPLFMETPRPCSPLAHQEFQSFDEIIYPGSFNEDEAFKDTVGNHSGRKTSVTVNTLDILSANQLIDSVLETARQVASFPISTTPVPYDQMKSQCEALVMGKQQKMSALLSMKHQNETVIHENGLTSSPRIRIQLLEQSKMVEAEQIRVGGSLRCSAEYEQSFRLPPSSPYDKFLKAAGC